MTEFLENSVGEQSRQRRGAVLIIGTGAVGGSIAVELARLGFSPLHLVDFDTLKQENIYRHPLGLDDEGKPKASALAAKIHRETGCWAFHHVSNFLGLDESQQTALIRRVALVVDATGSPNCRLRVNELCVANQVAAVYLGIWSDDTVQAGEVGEIVWVVPRWHTPCYECAFEWLPPGTGPEGWAGNRSDVQRVALVAVAIIVGIFDPGDRHAAVLNQDQTLILVHGLMSTSPAVRHIFGDRDLRSVSIPFPETPCRVCGGQEHALLPEWARRMALGTAVQSPPAQAVEPVSISERVRALYSTLRRRDTVLHILGRLSWLLGTILVILLPLKRFPVTSDQLNIDLANWHPELVFFYCLWLLLVVPYGLYRTFRPLRSIDGWYFEPRPWRQAAVALALLVFVIVDIA